MVIITETWLRNEQKQFFNFPCYTSYFVWRKEKRSGGVGILVKSSLVSEMNYECSSGFDLLCIQLSLGQEKVNIFGIYIPSQVYLDDLLEHLANYSEKISIQTYIGWSKSSPTNGNHTWGRVRGVIRGREPMSGNPPLRQPPTYLFGT